jgi:Cytosol aminopeptidase family, N-terminal domain
MSALKADFATLDSLHEFDAACCLVCQDVRPLQGAVGLIDWRLHGALTHLLRDEFYLGKTDEKLLLPASSQLSFSRIFVVGLGKQSTLSELSLTHCLEVAAEALQLAKAENPVLAFSELPKNLAALRPLLIERTFRGSKPAYFE